jgi:hypothetical protein
LAEFARVLAPGGTAIVSIPNRWGFTPYHFFDFDFEQLQALASEYFDEQQFYYNNSGVKADRTLTGIGPLDGIEPARAECILVVCRGPRKTAVADRTLSLLDEIYCNAFRRHQEFLELSQRDVGPFPESAAATVKNGSTLTLQADGLSEQPKQVLLRMPAEIVAWQQDEVQVQLPDLRPAADLLAQLHIVMADNRVVASPAIRLKRSPAA